MRAWLAWAAWLTARWRQGQVSAAIRTRTAGRGGFPAHFHPLENCTGPRPHSTPAVILRLRLCDRSSWGCRTRVKSPPRRCRGRSPTPPPRHLWAVIVRVIGSSVKPQHLKRGRARGCPHARTTMFRAMQPCPHVVRGALCLAHINLGPRGTEGQPQRSCPVEERPQWSHSL